MTRGRVVLITQGRFAGCKAVILENKQPSRKHKFNHCIVAGISKLRFADQYLFII